MKNAQEIPGAPTANVTQSASSDTLPEHGLSRRRALACMAWAGAGILWTFDGGVPSSLSLGTNAQAATSSSSRHALRFVQISDSHIGFTKAPNPDPASTLQQALDKIRAASPPPAFLIHTGDVSHLSKPAEFDVADQIVRSTGWETHYVPGEHDVIGDDGRAFFTRFSQMSGGKRWYSFDRAGVHFVAMTNVLNLSGAGLGHLGADQVAWFEQDLRGHGNSTPVVIFTHMPMWPLYPEWGWGTDDSALALAKLKRFGSVTILNGHIHQVIQKVEGNVTLQTAMSTAYPQPAPGDGPGPGPMKVPAERLRATLGVRSVTFTPGHLGPDWADQTLDT